MQRFVGTAKDRIRTLGPSNSQNHDFIPSFDQQMLKFELCWKNYQISNCDEKILIKFMQKKLSILDVLAETAAARGNYEKRTKKEGRRTKKEGRTRTKPQEKLKKQVKQRYLKNSEVQHPNL